MVVEGEEEDRWADCWERTPAEGEEIVVASTRLVREAWLGVEDAPGEERGGWGLVPFGEGCWEDAGEGAGAFFLDSLEELLLRDNCF